MSEVHRYNVVTMLSEGGNTIGYDPHGPEVVMATEFDRVTAERDALQQLLNAADQRIDDVERALGGMLFAFDDGVGRDWSSDLLDHARKLTVAVEFKSTESATCAKSQVESSAPVVERQEPVGKMISHDGDFYWANVAPPMGVHLYTSPPAPPAPASVVPDEREEFEKFYSDFVGLDAAEIATWRKGDAYSGSYERCNIAWEGWQARAALAAKS